MRPSIAIIAPNTLACVGLADIIHRMMPGADIRFFSHYTELAADAAADAFFHYFVSSAEMLSGASYFLQRQNKTIVLVHGDETRHLPQGFHTLNVLLPEKELINNILSLANRSHKAHGDEPEVVKQAQHAPTSQHSNKSAGMPQLTPREREVLCGIVKGLTNKEIAQRMGVSMATVITHRNNLTDKLGTRSVSALTIFAVMHGIVKSEQLM